MEKRQLQVNGRCLVVDPRAPGSELQEVAVASCGSVMQVVGSSVWAVKKWSIMLTDYGIHPGFHALILIYLAPNVSFTRMDRSCLRMMQEILATGEMLQWRNQAQTALNRLWTTFSKTVIFIKSIGVEKKKKAKEKPKEKRKRKMEKAKREKSRSWSYTLSNFVLKAWSL